MTGWMGTLTKIMTLTLIKFPLCAISNFHNNSQNKHLHSAEEGSEVRGSSVTCPKWGKLLIWNSDVSYSSSKTVLTIQHLSLSLSLSLSLTHYSHTQLIIGIMSFHSKIVTISTQLIQILLLYYLLYSRLKQGCLRYFLLWVRSNQS